MAASNHDVYIFSDPGPDNGSPPSYRVWPGTLAVSRSTPVIRFKNMTDATASVQFYAKPAWLRLGFQTIQPKSSAVVHINWFDATEEVLYYKVLVHGVQALANSEPRIIFD